MTPSELKRRYQEHNPDGHFFDRDSMKFFGDTMRNFGVKELTNAFYLYRKDKRPTTNIRGWYFSKVTFNIVSRDFEHMHFMDISNNKGK